MNWRKAQAALILMGRFAIAVVISGFQTLQVILFRSNQPNSCFVRMSFAPMTPMGASLLGCLITLTPGTTTVDVDMENRLLTLHLLDGSDPSGAVTGIRQDFEKYVVELFGLPGGVS